MNEFNLPYEGKRKNYNKEKQIKPKKTLMLCFLNALCWVLKLSHFSLKLTSFCRFLCSKDLKNIISLDIASNFKFSTFAEFLNFIFTFIVNYVFYCILQKIYFQFYLWYIRFYSLILPLRFFFLILTQRSNLDFRIFDPLVEIKISLKLFSKRSY